nr:small hydrophobic protein [Pohorje myodes paramyxovirus 1]
MERDSAIIFFIIGFLLIVWLILTVSWLLYITSKLHAIRADLLRRMASMLGELICNGSHDVLINTRDHAFPPPYSAAHDRDYD